VKKKNEIHVAACTVEMAAFVSPASVFASTDIRANIVKGRVVAAAAVAVVLPIAGRMLRVANRTNGLVLLVHFVILQNRHVLTPVPVEQEEKVTITMETKIRKR